MSSHTKVPRLQSAAVRLASADLILDQCRRLAGARLTGDPRPADEALAALRASLPREEAYRLFGLLHDLVATVDAVGEKPFVWHPTGARRRSADEAWLVAHALAPLSSDAGGEAAPEEALTLAESFCAAAERVCGLHTATGEPCARGCPFDQDGIGAAKKPIS